MSVTIKDVAREAKVSVASVSRVLNGSTAVTEATRKNVLNVVERMRYVPNVGARYLSTKQTNTIGVVLPDLYGEFFSELIRGIDAAARERNLHLLVSSAHGNAEEAASVVRAMSGRVDGLIVMSPHVGASFLASNLPQSLPTVLLNTKINSTTYSSINVDNYSGAFAMMRHLVENGYKRIAMISGPENNFEAQERLRGYQDALTQYLPKQATQILKGDFSEESGYRAGRQLQSLAVQPEAIFAANDMMAIGCLFALTEAGISVPNQIALVGFDDIPIARFVSPPLTTVRVRMAEMGGRALEQLAFVIENPKMTKQIDLVVKTELIIRNSCGTVLHKK